MSLEQNFHKIQKKLNKATLVAVTKYSEVAVVQLAYELGMRDFGENRVSDLESKAQYFLENQLDGVKWHFIGTLQTNKIKKLLKIPNLYAIHSFDSIHHLKELFCRINLFKGDQLKIFIQVNTSQEDEKSGVSSYEDLSTLIQYFFDHVNGSAIHLEGLMTMGTIRTENVIEDAKKCFDLLVSYKIRLMKDFNLSALKLSMGMSQDYEEALKRGSDYIRVGGLLFKD